MTPVRILAALAALAIAVSYLLLIPLSPIYSLFGPRGGIVSLGISLCLANVLVWLGGSPGFSARTRFELAVAGWIWILVGMCLQAYLHWQVRQ